MWTMPQPVLRLVALLLLTCAVGAFVLGILGAEPRGGRLPGEGLTEGQGSAPMSAMDAQALDLVAPEPPPIVVVQEEAEADVPAEITNIDPQTPALQVPDAPAPPPRAPPQAAPPQAPTSPANGDAIGDLVDGLSELPPF